MPELPEVETVKNQIQNQISGEEIVAAQRSKLSLRKELGCSLASLKGRRIENLSRWGKRLVINLDSNLGHFDVSLGMTGMLRVESKSTKKLKHDHIVFNLSNGKKLVYNDPRRFGWVSYSNSDFEENGWDPLRSKTRDFKSIVEQAKRSKKNIYSFLMDQKFIVGLGNIYVQEILFKSKVSPFRIAGACSPEEMRSIRNNTKHIIQKALNHGGSTILSYKNAEGERGAFQTKLKVYGKKKAEPCSICKTPLSHSMESRSISHCPLCQR